MNKMAITQSNRHQIAKPNIPKCSSDSGLQLFQQLSLTKIPVSGSKKQIFLQNPIRICLKDQDMPQRLEYNFLLKQKLAIGVQILFVEQITSYLMSGQPSLKTIPTRRCCYKNGCYKKSSQNLHMSEKNRIFTFFPKFF